MERIGRYRVLELVGRGGAGTVHRAVDPSGREVAVKLLLAGRQATPLQRRRFATEVQSLLRVRHPHVVQLLDAGEEAGAPYLVMEWVAGETLAQRLERLGPLPPREAVTLVCHLAAALEVSHREGVLHRDLKPGNVLLRAGGGQPVLTDFGLAKDLEASEGGSSAAASLKGRWLGTPGYWPPEQAKGELEQIGTHSDVYGLGALLFAGLTARPPQAGESLVELLAAFERSPTPPSAVQPGIPSFLDDVCVRCMARDPADRYPSVALVARDLRAWLSAAHKEEALVGGGATAPRRPPWPLIVTVTPLLGMAIGYLALRQSAPAPLPPRSPRASLSPAPAPAPDPPADPPRERAIQAFLRAVEEAGHARDGASYRAALERALPLATAALADLQGPARAAVLVRRGVVLYRLGRPVDAGIDFDAAAELDPSGDAGAEAVCLLVCWGGRPERALARDREAESDLWRELVRASVALARGEGHVGRPHAERALGLNPALALVHYLRAICWARGEGHDVSIAMQALNRAVELDPLDVRGRIDLATLCTDLERWDEARAHLDRALDLVPNSFEACERLVLFEHTRGRREEEVLALRRLIALAPGNTQIAGCLAERLLESADTVSEGETVLRQLERLSPRSPLPALIRSRGALRRGDGEGAIDHLVRAARTVPPTSELRYRLLRRALDLASRLPVPMGQRAFARHAQEIRRAQAEDPEGLWLELAARVIGEEGRSEEREGGEGAVLSAIAKAARERPGDLPLRELELLTGLARFGAGAARRQRMQPLLERFEADLGAAPLGQAVLANVWLQLGERQRAQEWAARALRLDPKLGLAAKTLAEAEYSAGRLAAARDAVAVALRGAEPEPAALHLLGIIEARMGRPQQALSPLTSAVELDPLDQTAVSSLLTLLLEGGRPRTARRRAEQVGQLYAGLGVPVSREVQVGLIEALVRDEELPRALELTERLVEGGPPAQVLSYVAGVLERHDPARALELVRLALAKDPADARALALQRRLDAAGQGE